MEEIPENFFISEEYKEYVETIGDHTQKFYASPAASTDYDLTGQIVWPGAKHLYSYILQNPGLIEGKIVLEVGSGSGLCGLVCSSIASKTILTDGNEIVLRLLELNKQFGNNIQVAMLEWNDPEPAKHLKAADLPGTYEVIIGADVVYWADSIVPLFKTVDALLYKEGKFIMCYTARATNTHASLLAISSEIGFSHSLLWQEKDTYIYNFYKI